MRLSESLRVVQGQMVCGGYAGATIPKFANRAKMGSLLENSRADKRWPVNRLASSAKNTGGPLKKVPWNALKPLNNIVKLPTLVSITRLLKGNIGALS